MDEIEKIAAASNPSPPGDIRTSVAPPWDERRYDEDAKNFLAGKMEILVDAYRCISNYSSEPNGEFQDKETKDAALKALMEVASKRKCRLGQITQTLRAAITGHLVGFELLDILWLLGRNSVARRIAYASRFCEVKPL